MLRLCFIYNISGHINIWFSFKHYKDTRDVTEQKRNKEILTLQLFVQQTINRYTISYGKGKYTV